MAYPFGAKGAVVNAAGERMREQDEFEQINITQIESFRHYRWMPREDSNLD